VAVVAGAVAVVVAVPVDVAAAGAAVEAVEGERGCWNGCS
jgi:hypothetical protein